MDEEDNEEEAHPQFFGKNKSVGIRYAFLDYRLLNCNDYVVKKGSCNSYVFLFR